MSETQGPTVITVAVVFGVLTFFVISLRLWARIFLVKSLGPDDALICVAVLLSWAFMIVTIIAVQHGLGRHYLEDVEPLGIDNMIAYMEAVWYSSIFYNACIGFIKLSVLALYSRLGDPTLRRLAFVMIGVVSCQAGGNVLACIFQCSPVKAAYVVTITSDQKKCININAFYLANAAVNIITDLMTYTLPIKLVVRLQVPQRTKISLGIILSLGLFACVSSIVRITYIPQMLVSQDATWAITGAMYWSVIEINIGILAGSIPSFKPIAKRYSPRLLGSSSMENSSGGKQSGSKIRSIFKSGSQDTSVKLQSIDGTRKGNGYSFGTHIERGLEDNSSEEILYSPGRIGVKTEIDTRFDQGQELRGINPART
ncbi:uncharacterized protein BCR38DRAFT_408706 [Pseudomassariella vexata]|uniref:Integral membrane protein n=1 Tax=Pseudomassariella vexata TaxID=1141098 RepID=A0A1Y2E0T6_9PEZI|nr:uncharacterized protein BCR38DRAFT_408706 [Pseudomassariella vexata]ORY64954.1 integral membrane protein [Pseudomassariella vexata]